MCEMFHVIYRPIDAKTRTTKKCYTLNIYYYYYYYYFSEYRK